MKVSELKGLIARGRAVEVKRWPAMGFHYEEVRRVKWGGRLVFRLYIPPACRYGPGCFALYDRIPAGAAVLPAQIKMEIYRS